MPLIQSFSSLPWLVCTSLQTCTTSTTETQIIWMYVVSLIMQHMTTAVYHGSAKRPPQFPAPHSTHMHVTNHGLLANRSAALRGL